MDLHADDDLSQATDAQLVQAYRDGATDAFGLLVARYRQELFHFLVRFMGNRASADDVFQEAFLQVHLSIDTFDTTRRFKPWLFTIAANKARDLLRKKSERPAAQLSSPVDDSGGERAFLDLMEADLPMPGQEAERAETSKLVQEVADSLPDHLREILLLAYFEQFPYKEIAQMLGIPLGTVKSRLHAAVASFAQLWKQRYGDKPPDIVG